MIISPEDDGDSFIGKKEEEAKADEDVKERELFIDPPPMYTQVYRAVTVTDKNNPDHVPDTNNPTSSSPSRAETIVTSPPLSPTKSVSVQSSSLSTLSDDEDDHSLLSRPNGVPIPSNIKPSNFIHVTQNHNNIKGSWLIDPTLSLPVSFLSPLNPEKGETSEEKRNNVTLDTKNGTIEGEVWISPTDTDAESKGKRVRINAYSRNGTITIKVHDAPSSSKRLPLHISCMTFNGAILLLIPRSFRGPLEIRVVNGSVHFSEKVQHLMVTTSVEGNGKVQRSFLGQLASGNIWEGDELYVESRNGNIRIRFDDEDISSGGSSLSGRMRHLSLLGRLFGSS